MVAGLVVVSFLNEYHVMEEGDLHYIAIIECWLVAGNRIFCVVQSIHKSLEVIHRALRIVHSSSPCGPIRGLYIFHNVNSIGPEAGKQDFEASGDVFAAMAPVVDYDVEASVFVG